MRVLYGKRESETEKVTGIERRDRREGRRNEKEKGKLVSKAGNQGSFTYFKIDVMCLICRYFLAL